MVFRVAGFGTGKERDNPETTGLTPFSERAEAISSRVPETALSSRTWRVSDIPPRRSSPREMDPPGRSFRRDWGRLFHTGSEGRSQRMDRTVKRTSREIRPRTFLLCMNSILPVHECLERNAVRTQGSESPVSSR